MPQKKKEWNRRSFLGAAGLTVIGARLARGSQANSVVRVGLLGCGGRGTADATSMMVNAGARVTALGDLFDDQLERARKHFDELAEKQGVAGIDAGQIFSGPRAFEQIARSSEVDAVREAAPWGVAATTARIGGCDGSRDMTAVQETEKLLATASSTPWPPSSPG